MKELQTKKWGCLITILLLLFFVFGALSSLVADEINITQIFLPIPTVPPTPTIKSIATLPELNVDELIHITSPENLMEQRKRVVEYIRGESNLSDAMPIIETPITLTELPGYRVDIMQVELEAGLESIVYYVRANSLPKNELVIYHTGHDGNDDQSMRLHFDNVRQIADAGYDVALMFMPLIGPNEKPVIKTECCGPITLMSHVSLTWLDYPLKPFVDPVSAVLNYADTQKFDCYHMVGFSGGGWTTTLYAALDPRITGSFPVAGSLPLWARVDELGDFEQQDPELYRIANYSDLYVMGSYGEERYQLQILNKFDSCCFQGERHISYEDAIQAKLRELESGEFSVSLDDSHYDHKISDKALEMILGKLAKNVCTP